METTDGEARVRERVATEMSRRGWTNADLARAAGIDNGTVGDLLAGTRTQKGVTRAKISRAFDWPPEGLDVVMRGEEPRPADTKTVGGALEDGGVLASLPTEALEGLDPADVAEVIAAARLSALQTARAIRRRLDDDR